MAEMPNGFGSLPVDEDELDAPVDLTDSNSAASASDWRSFDWGKQIRRPAIWGLFVLTAIVLAVQIWLLYL